MIYFDNAATTLIKPDCVSKDVMKAIGSLGNAGRGTYEVSLNTSRLIYDTRVKLAKLFNAEDPSSIAFTNNCTTALNIAINGLVNPGDEIVTTTMEHNSVLRPLYRLAGVKNEDSVEFINGIWQSIGKNSQNIITLKIVEADKCGVLNMSALQQAITNKTKAVFVTHASNVTGNINDIAKIAKFAHKNNALVVVDAAQTAGVIDIDVQALGIDILCFAGHKSLFGPQGTGGIYVNPKINLHPFFVGGSGVQTYNKEHPYQMPTTLEAGTLNSHGLAGLNSALDFINKTGLNKIREHEYKLLMTFYEGLQTIPNIKIYGDFSSVDRCAICSINIINKDSSYVSDILATRHNIATRSGGHCAPLMHKCLETEGSGVVRFSFSYFNTINEVDKSIQALKQIS